MWFFRKKQPSPVNKPRQEGAFKEGDIIYTQKEGKYSPYKILRIETWPDHSKVWHIRIYKELDHQPTVMDIKKLKIFIGHVPIGSLDKDAHFITNMPVTTEDLDGYYEYLKRTDYSKYAKETGQSVQDLVKKASYYFKKGNQLSDEKKFQEAITAYDQTIDIFPQFYEAIDNRGIARMDLALYEEASEDFKESLDTAPNMPTAQFSLGECYYRLGQYSEAQEELEKYLKLRNDAQGQMLLNKILIKQSQTQPEYTNSIQDFPGYNDELPAYYGNRKHQEFEKKIKERGQNKRDVINQSQQYFLSGVQNQKEKKYSEAIEAYQNSENLHLVFYKVLFNRAAAKMSLSAYADALIDLQKSLIMEPNDFLSTLYLAACYYHLGDYKRSKLAAEKAGELKADPRVDDLLADVNQILAASNQS